MYITSMLNSSLSDSFRQSGVVLVGGWLHNIGSRAGASVWLNLPGNLCSHCRLSGFNLMKFANTPQMRERRIRNALWGLFIGDALAMPAHWFYSLSNIQQYFDGGIRKYEAALHPHPESFMVGMTYSPDVETANRLVVPMTFFTNTSVSMKPVIASRLSSLRNRRASTATPFPG
jgi:hypothetical protein